VIILKKEKKEGKAKSVKAKEPEAAGDKEAPEDGEGKKTDKKSDNKIYE